MTDTMKNAGQQTAAGFASTHNQPIPQNDWQPMPETASQGQTPTFDATAIAPTTGPCADVLPAVPLDRAQFKGE